MRGELATIRYKGNPEGVNLLVDLLRAQGLKVSHNLPLNLPLQGQQWMIHRDVVQTYGTLIDVKGRTDVRSSCQRVIDDFLSRYEAEAEISLE